MASYYNEYDAFAAAWLRELIADGLIADGEVDERSILDVRPNDLAGYDQCHFFAGIGGWSHALRLAGWIDDREVWTGSCPCQPLSGAGQRKGHADERHLWPAFHALIAECRPATIFGEQVASKDGREWLSGVRADLEGLGYAVGGADLCAASVGAPHIRQRLWWVADASSQQRGPNGSQPDAEADGRRYAGRNCKVGGAGDADTARLQGYGEHGERASERSAWQASRLIPCADDKQRRIPQSSIFPLADGIPNRVGTLRGAGNAITPQVAEEFIRASNSGPENENP
jgi:DNA (cytosine-5)-methyltransferase 1